MNAIELAYRIHAGYEQRQWRARTFYTKRPWADLDDACRAEFIDIATAVLDGRTHFDGAPIPTWVRKLAKEHA